MSLEVTDQAHLEALPDGTLISWLRIPGDETSRAVAFVRVETETTPQGYSQTLSTTRTVWISPGGFAPQSPESAGVTYPAQIIVFGEFRPDDYPSSFDFPQLQPPLLCSTDRAVTEFESRVLMTGGTWAREAALEAAARVWQGKAGPVTADGVIWDAEKFEQWLNRPVPETDVIEPVVADVASDDWGAEGPPPAATDEHSEQITQLISDLDMIADRAVVWTSEVVARALIDRGWVKRA